MLPFSVSLRSPPPPSTAILGVIPRKCPREPLAELFWDLQTCDSDRDCWPRVCCPDGARKYCRTAQPELEKSTLSVARQLSTRKFRFDTPRHLMEFVAFFQISLHAALESVSRYIQCTPPPPAVFDQFPKKCNSTLDCFPNVCCQEAGRKHCRPPRRSLLSLLTGFASVSECVMKTEISPKLFVYKNCTSSSASTPASFVSGRRALLSDETAVMLTTLANTKIKCNIV